MHIIEQTFCKLEYDKFILHEFEKIPQDRDEALQELVQKYGERSQRKQHYKRLALLKQEPLASSGRSYYARTWGIGGVRQYITSSGETVYRIPVLSFRMNELRAHYTNCHLIIGKNVSLIDCGTLSSEDDLTKGFRVVNDFYKEDVRVKDINNIIITHAHIDHFGGLSFLHPKNKANVYAHEDDVRSIENIQEVLVQTRETIAGFLKTAGLGPELLAELLEMYTFSKRTMEGFPVSHPVQDGDHVIDEFEIIHVPGHCPGQINIRVGDIMFLGDHILMEITPHQFPRFYMKGMGLVHYIPSLLKISARSQKVRLGLGAHNEEVFDVRGRAMEIIDEHHNRLADLLSLMEKPRTLHELTTQYFTEIQGKPLTGYDRILALEEIQAHMEYLTDAMDYVEVTHEHGDDQAVYRYRRR